MTDTAQDLCTDILKDLKVYAQDETPTDADLQDVLRCLNDLLDEWSTDDLAVFRIAQTSHTLTASKGSYTIGQNGGEDISAVRPTEILDGVFLRDSNNYDHPLDVLRSREDYDAIVTKNTESEFPRCVWYDPGYPSGTLYYYPVPNTAHTVYLPYRAALTAFTALGDTVSFPPGYRLALRYNGALAAEHMFEASLNPRYVAKAAELKGAISSTNLAQRRRRVTFPVGFGRRRSYPGYARVQAGDY